MKKKLCVFWWLLVTQASSLFAGIHFSKISPRKASFDHLPLEVQRMILVETVSSNWTNAFSLVQVQKGWNTLVQDIVEVEDVPYLSLLKKKETLIQVAVSKDQQPEHLAQELLKFEQSLLERLLDYKESNLRTVEDWKRHGLAVLTAFYAARRTVKDVAWLGSMEGVASAWYIAACATMDAATDAVPHTVWFPVVEVATDAFWFEALDAATHVMTAVEDAMGVDSFNETSLGVNENSQGKAAEIAAWIVMLDPRLEVLQKLYDHAYLQLEGAGSSADQRGWFSSKVALEAKLNRYFGEGDQRLQPQSKLYFAYFIRHLRRIGDRVFDSVPL
ncbi:MAG: hypothetical protein OXT67_00830 [Zetaproteobacteria bacterium]|nr:hypothetical protein [Zetaproteobacteria bacterium]